MPGQGTDEGATQRTAWDDPGTRAAHANLLRRALGLLFVGAWAHWFSTLQLGALSAFILMAVALWEALALRRP